MGSSNESGGNTNLPHVEGIGRKTREASIYAIDATDAVLDSAVFETLAVLVNRTPDLVAVPPMADQQPQPHQVQAAPTYTNRVLEAQAQVMAEHAPQHATVDDQFQDMVANFGETATNAPASEMTTSDMTQPNVQMPVGGNQLSTAFTPEVQQTYFGGQTMDDLLADVERARGQDELESV